MSLVEEMAAKTDERGASKGDLGLTKEDLVEVLMDAIEQDRPFVIGVATSEDSALIMPSDDRLFDWWAQVMRVSADNHKERWQLPHSSEGSP